MIEPVYTSTVPGNYPHTNGSATLGWPPAAGAADLLAPASDDPDSDRDGRSVCAALVLEKLVGAEAFSWHQSVMALQRDSDFLVPHFKLKYGDQVVFDKSRAKRTTD